MRYQCDVLIKDELPRVTTLFFDADHRLKWQTNLKTVTPLENNEGFILTFSDGDNTYDMLETIRDNNLPQSITTIYEVKGVYNECKHTFEQKEDGVLWTMDVLFKFDKAPFQTEHDFKCKTESGMHLFKRYIENLEY
jgi:hypothetical protein